MTHDPLCPYIEDTDGVIYAWNECECDLIAAVRLDQTKILNSRVMYQSGYTDGYAHGYDMGLDHAIACFDEDDAYTAIQILRGIE
jgi:hypothetical protein